MLGSVTTLAKFTLIFLNIWVLAVVLVVSLGKWRVFETTDPLVSYDNSHLIVMRELKEDGNRKMVPSMQNISVGLQQQAKNARGHPFFAADEMKNPHHGNLEGIFPPSEHDSRLSNLRYWCSRRQTHQASHYADIPAQKLEGILVDETHHLLFCQIPGIALNDWRRIFLSLTGVVNDTHKISGGDIFGKYAKSIKRLSDYPDVEERTRMLEKFFKVAFVRDPLERLVMAYRSKLGPHGSQYFHKSYGTTIIKKYRQKPIPSDLTSGKNVKFSEFARYIVDNEYEGKQPLNEHWQQYYKQCHPCLINYDFIGTFENAEDNVKDVLGRIKADTLIQPPYITDTKILNQEELASVYKSLSTQELKNLYKVYSADYTLFGYKCPEFLHQLLEKEAMFHDY